MPRYARNGNVSLAYDVVGDGERDILVTFGWIGSFQSALEHPAHARWLERLGTFGRVIMWDKRGTGLSERLPADRLPTLEERMDDMRVVMDAAGSERAVAVGHLGGRVAQRGVRRQPSRPRQSLVLVGGFARMLEDDDYEWGAPTEEAEAFRRRMERRWGDNAGLLKLWAPSVADDPVAQEHWNRMMVFGGTPATATAWLEMVEDTDIRATLPAINVPTLVLHRADDRIVAGRARALHGRAHPGRALRRAARRRPPLVDRRRRPPRRDRVLPDRHDHRLRARPRAGHGDVHRHRGLHHPGPPSWATAAGATCRRARPRGPAPAGRATAAAR